MAPTLQAENSANDRQREYRIASSRCNAIRQEQRTNKRTRSSTMTRFFALLTCASALCLVGCAEGAKPGASPGVTVNETPDLNPQTDRDVDVTLPDVDVDTHQRPGKTPDVDVDVTKPRDADTKANETPGSDPDPKG
jgi:hypothetical protein